MQCTPNEWTQTKLFILFQLVHIYNYQYSTSHALDEKYIISLCVLHIFLPYHASILHACRGQSQISYKGQEMCITLDLSFRFHTIRKLLLFAQSTVEPLIEDPLRRGHAASLQMTVYNVPKRSFSMPYNYSNNTFLDLQEEDNISMFIYPVVRLAK